MTPEKRRSYHRAYYHAHCERIREQQRRYYYADPVKIRAQNRIRNLKRREAKRQWARKHKEHLCLLARARYNPIKARAAYLRYRNKNPAHFRYVARQQYRRNLLANRERKRLWWNSSAGRAYRESGRQQKAFRRWWETKGRQLSWERAKRWRAAHRDIWAEIHRRGCRRYDKSPKGRISAANARHRRRSRSNDFLRMADWRAILARQENQCKYCQRSFSPEVPATMDHVMPISRGGRHAADNIVAACAPCNSRKGSKWNFSVA